MLKGKRKKPKICLFGHFGAGNFGNESTLQAMLYSLRRLIPDAEVTCICTFPETVAADYHVATIPISELVVGSWNLRAPEAKLARKLFVGIPSEIYRWLKAVKTLWHTDMLIVVGTGLLTDFFGIGGWGPYSVFKWSVLAKLCRCKLIFVSAGAGPLERPVGRFLIKAALSLADFRSYRDESSLAYLKRIGFQANRDRIYPDLAFSLPAALLPQVHIPNGRRKVVGIGLMEFAGMYGIEETTSEQYSAYLEILVGFVKWLLAHDYNVRLLIGALVDTSVVREFRALLKERSVTPEEERITDEPITSATDLLSQLAATDFVVATRFHNLLLALFLVKPSISISFHHKCTSLMSQMGLPEYCQDIQKLSGAMLIEQFCHLESNAESLKQAISAKVADCRRALDEQYAVIFRDLMPERRVPAGTADCAYPPPS